ncbi:putative proton-dependent oligopeptide transporter family, major facilitator superfamily [Lupinus albus]|uniref:Putative proton-dependent oligopeptide transporter family, major facilitator superfamily n=1 Tax=Lupinus albus TaxID=3870 RepID=A0A6A4NPA3_LUPAL|nr:putative proton-dependent oligopeptide transporter family, major facilitator superfamily [Lupinus albus]
MEVEKERKDSTKSCNEDVLDSSKSEKKHGWKTMPYILGNETIERLATFGLISNFMVYLLKVFNLDQISAANVINIWSGVSNCLPIIGAFIGDACLGKFRTIAIASFGTLLGIIILTLTAWVPQFHPPSCPSDQHKCITPMNTQFALLVSGLIWMAIGTGGIRPCTIPFSIDQFDSTTPEGRKGINRFFNWYYASEIVIQLIGLTLIVYLQSKNWAIGFGTLGLLMLCAIVIFFAGASVYLYIPPEDSVFTSIAQVFVAAYKKHHLQNPIIEQVEGVYYDPLVKDDKALKIPFTKQLKCLNKAAMIQENELNAEGLALNSWRLCSIQQVEEVKCLIKLIPIWVSGFLCFIPVVQQGTFFIAQALKMDRHIGPHFEIPAASMTVVSLITIGIWLLSYEFFVQQFLSKINKQEEGLTSLQKIVIGNIFSILTMLSSGLIEWQRRVMAISKNAPISVMWLAPQFVLIGLCEVFTVIGHIQFYNSESPEKMRSVGNSLQYLLFAFSSYIGALVMNIVHKVTSEHSKIDWLNNDINAGRLDYYYFLLAVLAALNLVYLLFCVKRYHYKVIVKVQVLDTP